METSFSQMATCMRLKDQLDEYGLVLRVGREGQTVISADNTRHPDFARDNVLFRPQTVEQALIWLDGLLSRAFAEVLLKRRVK